ncbi:hypothetical protein [Stackebrandtia albiflava]|nr:hypothetical protein [Stackebrandtia albiflava]
MARSWPGGGAAWSGGRCGDPVGVGTLESGSVAQAEGVQAGAGRMT